MLSDGRLAEIEAVISAVESKSRYTHPTVQEYGAIASLPPAARELLAEVRRLRDLFEADARSQGAIDGMFEQLDSAAAHLVAIGRPPDRATCFGEAAMMIPDELARLRGAPAAIVGAIEREAEKVAGAPHVEWKRCGELLQGRLDGLGLAARVAREAIAAGAPPVTAEVPGNPAPAGDPSPTQSHPSIAREG